MLYIPKSVAKNFDMKTGFYNILNCPLPVLEYISEKYSSKLMGWELPYISCNTEKQDIVQKKRTARWCQTMITRNELLLNHLPRVSTTLNF